MIIQVHNSCGKMCTLDTDLVIKSQKIVTRDLEVFYRLVTKDGISYFIDEETYNNLIEFYEILEGGGI